jgi:hypothetical protein
MTNINSASDENQKTEKEKAIFTFNYFPLLLDFLLRLIALVLLNYSFINASTFWLFQLLLIPIPMLLLNFNRENKLRKQFSISNNVSLEPKYSAGSNWFLGIIVLTISLGAYFLYPGWHVVFRLLLSILAFFIFGFYCLVLYVTSYKSPPVDQELASLDTQTQSGATSFSVDINDAEIIRLETSISSILQQVDSYSLESTLFGALAFSAFISLLSFDSLFTDGVNGITIFLHQIFDKSIGQNTLSSLISSQLSHSSFIVIIAILTLMCSVFFLSVVVSRLRFYDFLRSVEQSIRLARAYNDKEEELYNLMFQINSENDRRIVSDRHQELNRKIASIISSASKLHEQLMPTVTYMSISRNLGILTFLLILIISASMISTYLAILFVLLFLVASSYTGFDKWIRNRKFAKIFERVESIIKR